MCYDAHSKTVEANDEIDVAIKKNWDEEEMWLKNTKKVNKASKTNENSEQNRMKSQIYNRTHEY
jgi:hypothetical protein